MMEPRLRAPIRSAAIREHIRSNVVGYLALFAFAASGTAQALPGENEIDHNDLQNHVVHPRTIHPGAVRTAAIADEAITTDKLAPFSVTGIKLQNGAVGPGKLAIDSVFSGNIADGAVLNSRIANGAVTSSKIATGGVSNSNLATGVVSNSKITDSAVTGTKIANGTVDSPEIGEGIHPHIGEILIDSGEAAFVDAACAPGEQLVGGGARWFTSAGTKADLFINAIRLEEISEEVRVFAQNESGVDDAELVAQAMCLEA